MNKKNFIGQFKSKTRLFLYYGYRYGYGYDTLFLRFYFSKIMSEYNTDRVFPYYHWPGTDLISKLVLTDKQVINMLSKALVPEMAEDSYVSAPTEFITGKKKMRCSLYSL